VQLAPLRERREDVLPLVNHFMRRFNRRFRRDVRGIAPDALASLTEYGFPGNVRELENLMERAYAMGARNQITLADLPSLSGSAPVDIVAATSPTAIPKLSDVEKGLILKALGALNDDKEAAARALGISRRTIYRRLKEYGMM
jgi:DNA-binding NtrC family response regulator